MDRICRGLSSFPLLKTITVTWQSYSVDAARLKGVELFDCMARQRTLELMQSFWDFGRENAAVRIVVEGPVRLVAVGRNTEGRRLRGWGLEEFMAWLEVLVGVGKGS